MSAAEKGEIEYSGLETAIIQSLREGERATLSVLMISGSGGFSGDTQIDVQLKDGSLQWLTMPMSRLERMRRDSGGLAAVVMRAVRVWLVASPLDSLVPRPTGPSTHSHLSGRSFNNIQGSRFPSRECTDLRGCPTVRLTSSTARPIRSCNARTLPRAAYSRQSRTSFTCKRPVYIPFTSPYRPFNRASIVARCACSMATITPSHRHVQHRRSCVVELAAPAPSHHRFNQNTDAWWRSKIGGW
jgi:hypothetical protein